MNCPHCFSAEIVKNGSNSVGTPKFLCKGCGGQFVEYPKKSPIKKANKQWVWLAIDVDSREIVGVPVGDRGRTSALAVIAGGVSTVCGQLY
jgi:hypothetical protein